MGSTLTKQEIVKEIVKAGKDPVYFTINYNSNTEYLYEMLIIS